MAILVTGGAGYIGSHTVYALIDAGFDVAVADNLCSGFREAVHPKARFYQVDVRDAAEMDILYEQENIKAVLHFAALSQVGASMETPLLYYENNLDGTAALLRSMEAHGVDKLVFSSSAAVYGEAVRLPVAEEDALRPASPYGESKLAAEELIARTEQAWGLRYVSLRYFNACGAHPTAAIGEAHTPETHLIPLTLHAALEPHGSVSVFGDDYPTRDGTCVRDYVHVCDLAEAHVLALKHLCRGGKSNAFNLGSGTGFTVKEVIEAARKVTGQPIPMVIHPRRPGDPAQLVACCEKARCILGWEPQYTDLEGIIASAWAWHREHPKGFRSFPEQ